MEEERKRKPEPFRVQINFDRETEKEKIKFVEELAESKSTYIAAISKEIFLFGIQKIKELKAEGKYAVPEA